MFNKKLIGLNKKSLRRWLVLFFLALAIPTALLIQQSYSRLKWEAFHQTQLSAAELASRIEQQLSQLITTEQQRPFTDYSFLNVMGERSANFFQPSPLSSYPVTSDIPGIIGYFQVDTLGQLTTPLIPSVVEQAKNYGISDQQLIARASLQNVIYAILSENSLVKSKAVIDLSTEAQQAKTISNYSVGNISKLNRSADAELPSSVSSEADEGALATDLSNANLGKPALADKEPVLNIQGQAAFDQLKDSAPKGSKLGKKYNRVGDLKLQNKYQQSLINKQQKSTKKDVIERPEQTKTLARKEQAYLPESISESAVNKQVFDDQIFTTNNPAIQAESKLQDKAQPLTIQTFASEIEPFEFSQLESGHFVLYRKVWRNQQRYIQGILIEQQTFLAMLINQPFNNTALSQMTRLLVAYQGNVLASYNSQTKGDRLSSTKGLSGELLYQTGLASPINDLQLLFSITELPAGPGARLIQWLAVILASVLCLGFYWIYRLTVGQINLANQQQDFVSAVSHELKTPLTSIRMYGEILREGWATEEKKKSYYNFIFDESERLSRLINNVLLMAKLTRNSQQAELKQLTVAFLIDGVKSKISTQIERSGFELNLVFDLSVEQSELKVNEDWFSQIMINLIDNAIKFSTRAQPKKIDISCKKMSDFRIEFVVRDYGPGIEKQQMKKIFQLFYRSENELTRKTVGTGIGLALVHQMMVAMNGKIDVVNTQPGVEFRLQFPVLSTK